MRSFIHSAGLLDIIAFAAEKGGASAPKPAGSAAAGTGNTTPAAAATEAKPKREAPQITNIRTDIPLPTITSGRGSKPAYDFDSLAVGASFGVKNKTAKNFGSILSSNHKKYAEPKKDANGNVIFKVNEVKDTAGNVTKVTTNEPETVKTRQFVAADCDPKTDPDGASVRIFRIK